MGAVRLEAAGRVGITDAIAMSATVGAAIVETDVLVIGASAAQLFFREVDRRGGPTPSTVSEIIAANKRALDHCTSDP